MDNENRMLGMLACSRAGHDKDGIYVIIMEGGEYVYLADGAGRPLERPKRKNRKHIQVIKKYMDELLRQKLLQDEKVSNEEIKRAVKLCKKAE